MNPPGMESAVWTRGRFLGAAAVLFLLQVALILLFADRAGRPRAPAAARTQFRALHAPLPEDQLLKVCFAGDPAVFVWPDIHGFSGRAWLSQRPEQYHSSNRLEAPSWLDLNMTNLGTLPPAPSVAAAPLPPDLAGPGAPALEPLPDFLPPETIQTQSVFRLQGEVRERWTGQPPPLPPQPSPQLLLNSVVEIGLNPAGDVLVHRLLARSGSSKADADALAAARALRFLPSPAPGIAWGQAVFEWHTSEETNPAAPK